jgi:ribosomal protein S18 acetylase RimI-like enzyme
MIEIVQWRVNEASSEQIAEHLRQCDAHFVPRLSSRVEVNKYAEKIANSAERFEAWIEGRLIGLVAVYCNEHKKNIAYITNVSVLREWGGKGVAAYLTERCIEHTRKMGMRRISLDVGSNNTRAVKLYEKSGFIASKMIGSCITMHLDMKHIRYD